MVKVEFFYSPMCPYCPNARRLLEEYGKTHTGYEVVEVNTFTDEGIERGMSLQVMAVPCIAVDGVIKLSGWPFTEADLDKAIYDQ